MCSIWGCSDEPKDYWGDAAEYVLFKCRRCGKETILCSREGRIFENDEEGRMIMNKMMTDPEFSLQCVIHQEFVKAEDTLNYAKRDQNLKAVREKYGLPEGFRQPDPVILLQKGLWRPKPSEFDGESPEAAGEKPKPKSKPKSKSGKPAKADGKGVSKAATSGWTSSGTFVEEIPEPTKEERLAGLVRRMEKHVAREEYEKAAKVRDQIAKMQG